MKPLKSVKTIKESQETKVITKIGLKYIRGGNDGSGVIGGGDQVIGRYAPPIPLI